MLDRAALIELIEHRYFANMDARRLEQTLACLEPDCVWRLYPRGTVLEGRDGAIRAAFEEAYARYPEMWHGSFEWIVDEQTQRVCATFDVRLVDTSGRVTELSNAKLFRVSPGGRFARLDLYLSSAEPVVGGPAS